MAVSTGDWGAYGSEQRAVSRFGAVWVKTAGGEPFRGGVGAACVKTPHFRVGLRLCGSKRQAVSHFKVEWGLYGPKLPISRWVGAMRVEMPHFATKKGGGGRNRRCESKHTISRGDWGRMGQNGGR